MCGWDFGGLGMLFRIGRGTFDGTLHCLDGRNDTMAAIGRLIAASKFLKRGKILVIRGECVSWVQLVLKSYKC